MQRPVPLSFRPPWNGGVPILRAVLWLVGAGCPTADDDDDDDTTGDLAAAVEDNPRSPLSCYVTWSTEDPATSAVEFGPDGALQHRIGSDELTEEHRVVVVGMRAETVYQLVAVSETADGRQLRSPVLSHETGPLPFDGLTLDVTVPDLGLAQPGWVLADLVLEEDTDTAYIVMFDLDGHTVWVHDDLGGSLLGGRDATLVDDGAAVLVGGFVVEGETPVEIGLDNQVLWEGPEQPAIGLDCEMHHLLRKQAGGNYLTLMHDYSDGSMGDRIVEFDPVLDSVWEWNTVELCEQICTGNPLWGNWAQLDPAENVAYYNSWLYSTLVKVDRATGEMLWMFGQHRDFTSTGEDVWYRQGHSPTRLPDGNLLVFDNGGPEREHSRVIEYTLDETAMTAEIVWEYPGDLEDPWKNDNGGSATRLDNGNTFVVTGTIFPELVPTRLFEVTPDLTKAWEVVFVPAVPGHIAACSNAKRIPALATDL